MSPLELVPLLSHLISWGKCRHCAAPIDRTHFWIELLCALVGGVSLALSLDLRGVFAALSGWLLIALAALDLKHFWLPNRLTAGLAALGFAAGFASIGPSLSDRLIGGLAGFASLWTIAIAYKALRKRDGLGGGDSKLFGAIGLWLGWQALPFVLLAASGLGLLWVAIQFVRGQSPAATDRIPLGALLAFGSYASWALTT